MKREKKRKKMVVPALANGDDVSDLDLEGGGKVGGRVGVALLKTVVLLDVVEVITTDDDGLVHLGRDDGSTEDATTDGNVSGEGALLVDVLTLDGGLGGLEAKSDLLVIANGDLVLVGLADGRLSLDDNKRDVGLLLERSLELFD